MSEAEYLGKQPRHSIDWSQFPELVRATTFGGDIDAYLTDIGVDPSVLSGDDIV